MKNLPVPNTTAVTPYSAVSLGSNLVIYFGHLLILPLIRVWHAFPHMGICCYYQTLIVEIRRLLPLSSIEFEVSFHKLSLYLIACSL